MKIGEVLKELRLKRKLTQDELADLVGTSAANISRIETGKHGVGSDLLNSIAFVFELKVYQIIAMAEGFDSCQTLTRYSPDEINLISLYRLLNNDQKKLMLNTAEILIKHGK